MVGISLWRVLRSAAQNFRRNIWLSLATTVIMVITLCMMTFLYFANVFGAALLKNIEQKVDLSVTFKDKVGEEHVQAIVHEMQSRSDVESIRIVTSQQALDEFRRRHKDEPFIEESLKQLADNPLPASLFIVAKEPRFYQTIAQQLSSDKYSAFIEKVNFENSRPVIDRLISIIQTIKQASLVVTITFSLLVVLIMFNTVRLAIYSFREEIDIMRLVGASRWFIQGPFLIEAVFVALLGVGLTVAIMYIALQSAAPVLERFFFDQSGEPFNIYAYATSHWVQIIGLQVALAVGLAAVSSLIGIRRYLRE